MAQSVSHAVKTLSELKSDDFQKFCRLLVSRGELKKGTYSKPSEVMDILVSSLGSSQALSLVEASLSRLQEKTSAEQMEIKDIRSQLISLGSTFLLHQLLEDLQDDGVLSPPEKEQILVKPETQMAETLIDLVINKDQEVSRKMLFWLKRRDPIVFEDVDDEQTKLHQMRPQFISSVTSSSLNHMLYDLEADGVLRLRERQQIQKIPDVRDKARYLVDLVIRKGSAACSRMLFHLGLDAPPLVKAIKHDTSGISDTGSTSGKMKMEMEPSWSYKSKTKIFKLVHAKWLTGSETSTHVEAEWTKLEPEVRHPDDTWYSLQCGPGKFECTVSGLRWISSDTMSFKYRFGRWWEHKQNLETMQYMAGGPLLDITVNDGQFDDVYLPHWICINAKTAPVKQFAVLCVDADGYFVEKVSEVTSSHVRLPDPVFSLKGVLARIGRWFGHPMPMKCKVLIYQTTKTFLTLHVYLILSDRALEEALDKKAQTLHYVKIEKPYPDGPLELDDQFYLKADDDCAQVSPDV